MACENKGTDLYINWIVHLTRQQKVKPKLVTGYKNVLFWCKQAVPK